MNIPWDQLFEMVFQLHEDCGDTEAERVDIVSSRPFAVRMGVTRSLRKLGFRGRDLRAARSEVLEEINDADAEEIRAFCKGGPAAVVALKSA